MKVRRRSVNWEMIRVLPNDGKIYQGSEQYAAFRVLHAPATKLRVECLFAEIGEGLLRRRMVRGGFASEEMIGGRIDDWATKEQ